MHKGRRGDNAARRRRTGALTLSILRSMGKGTRTRQDDDHQTWADAPPSPALFPAPPTPLLLVSMVGGASAAFAYRSASL